MNKVYTVSDVNKYLKDLLFRDIFLNSLKIKGEISNLKKDTRGHLYFTLKDRDSQISAIMFRSAVVSSGLRSVPANGDTVIVSGYLSIYEKSGRYQIYVSEMRKEGKGDLYEKFQELKKKLEESGMFDERYKIPVKKYNMRIGIVTAETGAVIQDIANIAKRRNPYVSLFLYPSKVQGEGAAENIVRGIEFFNRFPVDVIIIGRGGGSLEDLWAFNEEIVARAVFNSAVPVISAVGHETDFTISDMAADLRAPTPSAACELAVFDINEYYDLLSSYRNRISVPLYNKMNIIRRIIGSEGRHLKLLSPQKQLNDRRLLIADTEKALILNMENRIRELKEKSSSLKDGLEKNMTDKMRDTENRIEILIEKLKGLSPLDRLKQGFSYTEDANGGNIASIEDVLPGDRIRITVTDGRINALVNEVEKTDGR